MAVLPDLSAHRIRRVGKEQNQAIGAFSCVTKSPAADAPESAIRRHAEPES